MKVYTKTGDEGMTSLVGGQRVPKTHLRLEAYGTIDELNSHIGLLMSFCQSLPQTEDIMLQLDEVQHQLFVVGSNLATDTENRELRKYSIVEESAATTLEQQIDDLQVQLPHVPLFIMPTGCVAASQAHVCRTVCRRAERCILRLHQKTPVDETVRQYVNRLSDYLFVLARYLNVISQTPEKSWRRG